MRTLILAIAAALLATSASAQTASLSGFSPFRFGMSDAEARAVDPSLQVLPFGTGEITLLNGRNPTNFGRIPLHPILLFRSDRLTDVTYTNSGRVADADECADLLRETVIGFERSLGPASAVAAPDELGERLPTTRTSRGSELRHYTNADGSQRASVATWRADGLWGRASGLYTVGIFAPDVRLCSLEVSFRAEAPPTYAPLTPPTAEALARASPITIPQWEEEAGAERWELALPGWRQRRNVEVDVELDCLVIADGAVNCIVARESPEGHYFGEAALYLSRFYRIAERINGEATEGRRVSIPLQTRLFVQGDTPPPGETSRPIPIEELRALAAQAPSQTELDAATMLTVMVWTDRPTAQDFNSYYPPAAIEQNLGGRATLDCLIQADGSLRCAISSEEPEDVGFGLAALGIARTFRAAPEVDGQPTAGGRVRIPITFRTR